MNYGRISKFVLQRLHCRKVAPLFRLVQLTEVQFDREGWLQGGAVEMALPDTSRLLRTGAYNDAK